MKTSIIAVVVALSALTTLGFLNSGLSWPLQADALVPVSLYALAAILIAAVLITLVILTSRQQRALIDSLELQRQQQRGLEAAQLMERFVFQAETLLEKESLDPSKRSVQRCLAIDALRGNNGRGDPNYQRLGRLFEWLADEADEAKGDTARRRLIDPVLRQYAEIADQLCRIGECDTERLAVFLRYQPRPLEDQELDKPRNASTT